MNNWEYGNIKDVQPGDIVEYTYSNTKKDKNSSGFETGGLYIADSYICNNDHIYVKGPATDNYYGNFKLVLTKPGGEANCGDKVICIDNTGSLKAGDTFTISKKSGEFLYPITSTVKVQAPDYSPKDEHNWDMKHFKTILPAPNLTKFIKAGVTVDSKWKRKIHFRDNCPKGEIITITKIIPKDTRPIKWGDGSSQTLRYILENFEPVLEPTTRRNLAFYKRSGEPWSQEEFSNVVTYCMDGDCGVYADAARRKWLFDNGDKTAYMYQWVRQEKQRNFKNCKQAAYEDIFEIPFTNPCCETSISEPKPCAIKFPEEEIMPESTQTVIQMTAKERMKYENNNKSGKHKTEFNSRKPFTVRAYNPDGSMNMEHSQTNVKSLKAASKLENNYLQDAKAGATVTIHKEISASKRSPAELVSTGTTTCKVGEVSTDWVPHTTKSACEQVKEPKKMIKVHNYRYFAHNHWIVPTCLYKDEKEAKKGIGEDNVVRLDYTEQLVENY